VIKGKYHIAKRCTNMGGSKNVKEHNEKKGSLSYMKGPKFKIWVVQKLKGLKYLADYIKWIP
jgi:hypothetical protein